MLQQVGNKAMDLACVRPWLAWIERALSTRVQFLCWSVGEEAGPTYASMAPVVMGSPRIPVTPAVASAISGYRASLPPDGVLAGIPHREGQELREALGGVPAIIRVGSREFPIGVVALGNRGYAYTREELGLVGLAAQRMADAITHETLQRRFSENEAMRLRTTYERDSLIDFARGLATAETAQEVCRQLLLLAMGVSAATGGYVALAGEDGEMRISAVRGHVLLASNDLVEQCMGGMRPVFPGGTLMLPIISAGRSLGYLVLGGRLVGGGFSHLDLPILEAAVAQSALAIENARLREGKAQPQPAGCPAGHAG